MRGTTIRLKIGFSLVGLTTILIGCGGGGLPLELSNGSNAPAAVDTTPPAEIIPVVLNASALPPSVAVGGTSIITTTGGTGYVYRVSNSAIGTVVNGTFTALSTGDVDVIITDVTSTKFTSLRITVTAAQINQPSLPTYASTLLFEHYSPDVSTGAHGRMYLATTTSPAGYAYENIQIKLLKSTEPNSTPLIECYNAWTFYQSYFTSTTCGANSYLSGTTSLGSVFTSPGPGLVALRRYKRSYVNTVLTDGNGNPTTGIDYLMQQGLATPPSGFTDDVLLGYVPAL